MLEVNTIAAYLIYKRIVSNHALSRWLLDLSYSEKKFGNSIFPNDWFIQKIHALQKAGKIKLLVASFLLQITLWKDDAIEFAKQLNEQDIYIVNYAEDQYPVLLKAIPDKPGILFMRGDARIAAHKHSITIVGTRNVSSWGALKARQLSYEAANLGVVTISGFARGVDTIVLEETLKYRGKSVLVLPEIQMSTSSSYARRNILEISEYISSDVPVAKWQFVARNRIAAGLSRKTVVIEAPIRSGTLITADLAIRYDRELYVVLPNPMESGSYGGIVLAQAGSVPKYINSLYDMYFLEGNVDMTRHFTSIIKKVSDGIINIPKNDYRHLSRVNVKRYIFDACKKDLVLFEQCMLKLLRFGIVLERKGVVLFNFSGYRKNGKEFDNC